MNMIEKWAKLVKESENDSEIRNGDTDLDEARTIDYNFFEGKGEPKFDFENDLKKIGIENKSSKMYAISGSLVHFLAQNIKKLLESQRSIEKADALDSIREYFDKKDRWEEVAETEKHAKDREFVDGASAYYASKTGHDNFTGD